MARIQTGTIAGVYVQLVTDTLELHRLVTELDAETRERIRDALDRALAEIVSVLSTFRGRLDARVRQ